MCPFIQTDRQTDGQKDIEYRLKDKPKPYLIHKGRENGRFHCYRHGKDKSFYKCDFHYTYLTPLSNGPYNTFFHFSLSLTFFFHSLISIFQFLSLVSLSLSLSHSISFTCLSLSLSHSISFSLSISYSQFMSPLSLSLSLSLFIILSLIFDLTRIILSFYLPQS